ncbi:MAG: hypothetical protein V2B19_18205 [Pseudomonadota bacterium]
MAGLYRTIIGMICGLMFLCGFDVTAYGAGGCVTEVLDKETTAFVVSGNPAFGLQLKKENDLIPISNPKEVLNEEGVLKENFLYPLPSGKYKEGYELKNPIVVQAENGQRYSLAPETAFQLVFPPGNASAANFKVIIPEGEKLIKKEGIAPEQYELAEDLTADVTFQKNSRITLKLYPQTIVERVTVPGAGSMGTTLTVEPKKAPLGGYIRLAVKKRDFEFARADFYVCLRLHGKDAAGKKEFFASDDVELQKAERGEAVLRIRIPEKMDGLGGLYWAKPADLLVVAHIPGDGVRRAEVTTQEFSVSSRPMAVLTWILAFFIPWFIAALVAGRTGRNTLAMEAARIKLKITAEKLEASTQSRDTNRIAELTQELEERKKVLERTTASSETLCKDWKTKLNPVWIVSGKVGGASLSLAQILLWSVLVFSASFYVWVVSGKLLDLTNDVLMLLGIAGGASVIAKITASAKDGKGQALAGETEREPKWLDLIKSEGRPDLYKFQMALFTTLAAVFVTREIYSTLTFPILPAGLLTLIGMSNGVYLTAKASSKTAFEELAEIDRERQNARETLEKLKDEATKWDESVNKATGAMATARTNLTLLEGKLAEAKNVRDATRIADLTQKLEELKGARQKAIEDQRKASDEKKKAEAAVTAAEKHLDKLREDFEAKKNQALQQG